MPGFYSIVNEEKFKLPDMGEYYDEDLVQELLQKTASSKPIDQAYYIEEPPRTALGYHPDYECFVMKAQRIKDKEYEETNVIDADTMRFSIDSIDDGNRPFTANGQNYRGIKEYLHSRMNMQDAKNKELIVRSVGINAPEICHMKVVTASKEQFEDNVVKKTIDEIIEYENEHRAGSIVYEKLKERKTGEKYSFIKQGNRLFEIVKDCGKDEPYPDSKRASRISELEKQKIEHYLIIVNEDKQKQEDLNGTINTAIQGKDLYLKLLDGAEDMRLILDGKQLNVDNKLSGPYQILQYGLEADQGTSDLFEAFLQATFGDSYKLPKLNTWGQDGYRRFFGCVYVKTKIEGSDTSVWINVNKYLIAKVGQKYINIRPDISPVDADSFTTVSDAFKVWSYNSENSKLVDVFFNESESDLDDRRKIQKQITGLDFEQYKEYTVMIGDCLFMVPPTSIRVINQMDNEKISLLRSKGSMFKTKPNHERIIQLTLYFNGDHGINGAPMKTKLPNGEEVTYYMNGLRSLISMFKHTPFLPIENEYINETLDIEAVSLAGLNIETMPMYPQCLVVSLTLQSFNYRIYLNDLPVPDPDKGESYTKNMFSSCINYEVMRYYNQRSIMQGEALKSLKPNSQQYIEQTIGSSTKLVPMEFKSQDIEFFILDKDWLDKLLELKQLAARKTLSQGNPVEAEVEEWANDISEDFKTVLKAARTEVSSDNGGYKELGNIISAEINGTTRFITGVSVNTKENTIKLHLNFNGIELSKMQNLIKVVSKEVETQDANAAFIKGEIDLKFKRSEPSEHYNISLDTSCSGYKILDFMSFRYSTAKADGNDWGTFAHNINDAYFKELKDNAMDKESFISAKFVPHFVGNIVVQKFSVSMNNILSNIELKAYEGKAPQYCGGQDTVIEFTMYTKDKNIVRNLNTMQAQAAEYMLKYRSILNCFPIRISSELTKFCGINEVAIESIDIQTVPMQPGLFAVNVRALSVDRTMRNRERLQRIDAINNAGNINSQGIASYVENTYFDLNRSLAQAEVYPDLELPTLDELTKKGFKFIRYVLSKNNRVYPDPDFYFVYAYSYSSKMLKKSITDYFDGVRDANGTGSVPIAEAVTQFSDNSTGQILEAVMAKGDDAGKNVIDYKPKYESMFTRWKEKKEASEKVTAANMGQNQNTLDRIATIEKEYNEKFKDAIRSEEMLLSFNTPTLNVTEDIKCTLKEKYIQHEKADELKTLLEKTNKEIIAIIDEELAKPISNQWNKTKPIDQKEYHQKLVLEIDSWVNGSNSSKVWEKILDKYDMKPPFNDGSTYAGWKDVGKVHISLKERPSGKIVTGLFEAAAMTLSGDMVYNKNIGNSDGKCASKGYVCVGDKKSIDNNNKSTVVDNSLVNKGKYYAPYCIIRDKDNKTEYIAPTIEKAIKEGISFGPFQIRKYEPEFLNSFYESKGYDFKEPEFLDPYYNSKTSPLKGDAFNKAVKEYMENIITTPRYSVEAFNRICLLWVRDLLKKDAYTSFFDVNRKHLLELLNNVEKKTAESVNEMKDINYTHRYTGSNHVPDEVPGRTGGALDEQNIRVNSSSNVAVGTQLLDYVKKLKDLIDDCSKQMSVGKMFIGILSALIEGDPTVYDRILNRDMGALKQRLNKAKTNVSTLDNLTSGERRFVNYVKNLMGTAVPVIKDSSSIGAHSTSKLDEAMKEYNEKLWVEASNDPTLWVMHSFYDMVTNNKRGRMARAFPTYYMMLIDEGREIGYWKLHDNFYNTSSIAEIEVTKSRKIPADTARIVLTNMFKTFTNEDEDLKVDYTHNLGDVWNSIFSPEVYFEEEELNRLEEMNMDRVTIRPGARIHLRMGYSSDAASLPIMFNGVVAEVSNGEVIEVVAQGDGHEISNPEVFSGTTAKDMADLENESHIFKWIENFFDAGATPKQLLKNVLTTKSGVFGKLVSSITNGRFFNDNMFGVAHFGSIDYKDLHGNGEIMQNIYEGEGMMPWHETKKGPGTTAELHAMPLPPSFTVELKGKSINDLLKICTASSLEFMSGVTNFGVRSTIFHGRPHYYYAYDYTRTDVGGIAEKRKPFQQYHLIDSYSDIIYNSVMASGNDVRTCAVVNYRGPDWKNKTVEKKIDSKMWIDFNIYPEFQKTTVINTQMEFKGNKLGALLINGLYDRFSKNGGAKIAWRMGANALKNSVRDMYTGDIGIIGDAVIKPYDRIWLHDVYENMNGAVEVEAIVHRMTPETGFTSSIYVDCISTTDSRWEDIGGMWTSQIFHQVVAARATTFLISKAFNTSTRPILKTLATTVNKGMNVAASWTNSISNLVSDKEIIKRASIEKWSSKFFNSVGLQSNATQLWSILDPLHDSRTVLNSLSKGPIHSVDDLLKVLSSSQKALDATQLSNISKELAEAQASGRIKSADMSKVDDAIDQLKNISRGGYNVDAQKRIAEQLGSCTDDIIKQLDNVADLSDDAKAILTKLKKVDLKDVSKITSEVTSEVLSDLKKITGLVDDIKLPTDDIIKAVTKMGSGLVDDIDDIAKITSGVKNVIGVSKATSMAAGLTTMALTMAAEMAIMYVITKSVYDKIEMTMASLRVLKIYPLKKNGVVMVAGIDGHKGLVVGSPTYEKDGMFDKFIKWAFKDHGTIMNFLLDGFVFSENMRNIAETYHTRARSSTADKTDTQMTTSLLKEMSMNQTTAQAAYKAMILTPRISAENDINSSYTFRKTSIRHLDDPKLKDLVHITKDNEALAKFFTEPEGEPLFKTIHASNNPSETTLNLTLESKVGGTVNYSAITLGTAKHDIPFLRPDAFHILNRILYLVYKEVHSVQVGEKKNTTLFLKSATVIDESKNTWSSTGYVFRVALAGGFTDMEKIIKTIQDEFKQLYTDTGVTTPVSGEEKNNHSIIQYRNIGEDNTYEIFVSPKDEHLLLQQYN